MDKEKTKIEDIFFEEDTITASAHALIEKYSLCGTLSMDDILAYTAGLDFSDEHLEMVCDIILNAGLEITGLPTPDSEYSAELIFDSTESLQDKDADTVKIEELPEKEKFVRFLEEAFRNLTKREENVLRYRFGLDDGRVKTLKETGREFGITAMRVRLIEHKVFRRIHYSRRPKPFRKYLEEQEEE